MNAGVVVGFATLTMPPVQPTVVTVPPEPVADSVPAVKATPVPIVTLEKPPKPLP